MATSRVAQRGQPLLRSFYGYFVANKEVSAPASKLAVVDKFTGEVASHVGLASKEVVEEAIQHAVKATPAMKALPHYQRKAILMDVAAQLTARQGEFAQAITVECGKPLADSKVEVGRAIDTFTASAEEAVRQTGEYEPLDISARNAGFSCITRRFPAGPISMISPFNFPLNLVAHKVAPAIAAGCPWVLKPSDRTPVTALLLGELLAKTALPEGSFSILPVTHEDASMFSKDERFKIVSFTGSPGVGWKIKNDAGKKKVILELGGNAACVVDKVSEARLQHAASRILFGAFYSAGQSCISVQRIYVHDSVYDSLKEKLVRGVKDLNARKGDPLDPNTFLGPLITPEDAERVDTWVKNAVRAGARVLAGGQRDGRFYDLTIVENVDDRMELKCKEVFGPVCTLERFTDFKSVVDRVNDSPFGLQAGVFTDNLDTAFYAYNHIDAGGVVINDIPSVRVDTQAYGGIKDSGFGREGIRHTIDEYTELKTMIFKDVGANP